ncbi:DUF2512 family protein [Aneurinibacillus sp. BA2021]|nr:DUF2512 family protein [Aneurinibacillus sp. BA2021]
MHEPLESIDTIIIKVVAVTGMLTFVLGLFYHEDIRDILGISFLLCIISYYVGDLIILPLTNNLIATISDFALAFLMIYLIGLGFFNSDTPVLQASLIAAAAVAFGEYILHIVMQSILHEQRTE